MLREGVSRQSNVESSEIIWSTEEGGRKIRQQIYGEIIS